MQITKYSGLYVKILLPILVHINNFIIYMRGCAKGYQLYFSFRAMCEWITNE
jgi:hypothetical protein